MGLCLLLLFFLLTIFAHSPIDSLYNKLPIHAIRFTPFFLQGIEKPHVLLVEREA